jgi:hypothetical protein
MSGTSLVAGEVFGVGETPEPGQEGTVSLAELGEVAISGSPLEISSIIVSADISAAGFEFSEASGGYFSIESLTINAVYPVSRPTVSDTDLPPPGLTNGLPESFTVEAPEAVATVTTSDGQTGPALLALFGTSGNLTLVGVESLFNGAVQAPGAWVLSSGNQQVGSSETFTTQLAVTCYAAGTRLDTPRGPVAIESLAPGDAVSLAGGGISKVVWLGHRRVDCRRHPSPRDVWPVRVAAGAFAPGRPRRDLKLSPDHALFIDGVLIPVRYLVNGATIRREKVASVEYWHVELPRHAVLLAEGLPAESYLDTGNRHAFANGGETVMAHPVFDRDATLAIWARDACARLALDGPKVARARARLRRRATALGWRLTDDADPCLWVDDVAARVVRDDDAVLHAVLPTASRRVGIASRSFVPAHLDGAADWRRLGVAADVTLDGEALPEVCFGPGFLAAEPGADWRWTDGAATLRLPVLTKPGLLSVRCFSAGGHYWLPPRMERATPERIFA